MIYFFKLIFKSFYRFISDKHYRAFHKLAYRLGDKPRYKETKTRIGDLNLVVPDPFSFIWQYYEIYAEQFYNFTTQKNKPVIYDCGANIGLSVLYFKSIYPEAIITAFEADPKIADYLEKNLADNSLSDVKVERKAVWVNDQGINLVSEGADGASAFIEGSGILVPSINLKEVLEKENEVDMLKMDIEGAETQVLLNCGSLLSKVKNLFIEYHSYRNFPQELSSLLALLENNGFRYYILSPAVKPMPLVYKFEKKPSEMDLQINIFAYQTSS